MSPTAKGTLINADKWDKAFKIENYQRSSVFIKVPRFAFLGFWMFLEKVIFSP